MSDRDVLVIDDSATIGNVVRVVLGRAGIGVRAAGSGEEGLALARERRPALILLDFVMPRMNGYQVCRALAADEALHDVPVVLLSAKGDQIGERFVQVTGIVDYLTKPFSPEALVAVVEHTLARFPSGARPGAARPQLEILDDDEPSEDEPTDPGGRDPGEAARRRLAAVRSGIAQAIAAGDVDDAAIAARVRERLDDATLDALLSRWLEGQAPGGGADSPALAGDVARVPVPEVLNLLAEQRHTGVLSVSRGDRRVEVCFRAGRVDFAGGAGLGDEFRLGRYMLERPSVSREGIEAFFAAPPSPAPAAGREPAALSGQELVRRGIVTEDDLRRALARQTCERVHELLRWRTGRFSFLEGPDVGPPARHASLGLAVDGILLEGVRRVDQWHVIEREIDDFDAVFLRDDEAVSRLAPDRLTGEEEALLELVNGRSTVRDLIRQSRKPAFDVAQVLFRLCTVRLVRRRVAAVAV